ncbi:DNA-binding PadR family transcriptional regulator [Anaerotaenia torta]|uniref:PadR family transcriptional regulator n=1 Tax=Anaerotaenia torta TaxID=433293 RepID=UPI003D1BA262
MKERIKRIYLPMTETGFYILFCLQEEMHGYSITQRVKEMTGGEVIISAGTMYGSLSKMEQDNLIRFIREEGKRKSYQITPLGKEILDIEIKRIKRVYENIRGGQLDEKENYS